MEGIEGVKFNTVHICRYLFLYTFDYSSIPVVFTWKNILEFGQILFLFILNPKTLGENLQLEILLIPGININQNTSQIFEIVNIVL